MMKNGDTDPAYSCLLYLANRFDITLEQRYWLAFLYSTCYCGVTAWYIFNEFPDYKLVNFDRMERWWKANREKVIFTTDKAWVRSRNQFVDMVRSYTQVINSESQAEKYFTLKTPDKILNYENCYNEFGKCYQMGRFGLFLYLESVYVLTGFPMSPNGLDLKNAESSRNGLCFALGRDDLVTHKIKKPLSKKEYKYLYKEFWDLFKDIEEKRPNDTTVWSVETTLCAYKKYKYGKRYIGYYIERQRKEIEKIENLVTEGVDWSVLWQYRKEYFDWKWLKEIN